MPGIWRTARVFLSSTFRDMHAERDHLVKVVFPKLREELLPYRVELIDIDLRWGVTREQAENDQVLALCLEQIDECPFFLGILGDHYGTLARRYPDEAVRKFGWLVRHPHVSYTELEVLHGALNDGAAGKRRALFCLRAPEAALTIPEPARSGVFCETDGERRAKLDDLKARIRSSSAPVRPYPCRWAAEAHDRPTRSRGRLVGLGVFGNEVHSWLASAVRAEFTLPHQPPAAEALDPLLVEADYHERFLESRLRAYVGRAALNRTLHAYARGNDEEPCLLVGPSGCGKSAALARFADTFRREHPGALVLPHFTGAAPHSTPLRDLLGRLCEELKRHCGSGPAVPETTDERVTVFLGLLAGVPAGRRVVLVLDALNQLDPDGGALDLHWLPERLLPHVKVVASCADPSAGPSPVLAAFAQRPHCSLEVAPLTDAERRQIIRDVPKVSAKTLDDQQIDLLLSNPATANALFLLVALEELRGFSSFEGLTRRIVDFPRDGDALTRLFGQVFERLEDEFDRELVRALLVHLASARRGLSERELQELALPLQGKDDLFPVLRQMRPYLLSRGGLLGFYHANVGRAVRECYLPGPDDRRRAHLALADYFQGHAPDARQVEELPWQLAEARAWDQLAGLLADLSFLARAVEASEFDVRSYWALLQAESPYRMTDVYRPVLANPAGYQAHPILLAKLFQDMGYPAEALALYEYLVARERQGEEPPEVLATFLGGQAQALLSQGRFEDALPLLAEEEELGRRASRPELMASALNDRAEALRRQGRLDEAADLYRRAEQGFRQAGIAFGLAATLNNLGAVEMTRGRHAEAVLLFKEQEQLCRRLNDQVALARCLSNQAEVARRQGRMDEALPLFQEVERLARLVGESVLLMGTLNNQALIQWALGDLEAAQGLWQEVEPLARRVNALADLSDALHGQAAVLRHRGELDRALELMTEAERYCRRANDPERLCALLCDRAALLHTRGESEQALALLAETEELCRQTDFPNGVMRTLGGQALILGAQGRLEEALGLLARKEALCRQVNDPIELATTLNDSAEILRRQGQFDEALHLLHQAEQLFAGLNVPGGLVYVLNNQAVILQTLGRADEAAAAFGRLEELCRRLNDSAGLARCLSNRADLLRLLGRPEEADELLREAEGLARALRSPALLAPVLINRALILIGRDSLDEALGLLRQAEELYRRLNDPAGLALVLGNQGVIHLAQGRPDEALRLHGQEEELYNRVGDPVGLARCLKNQAIVYTQQDRPGELLKVHEKEEALFRRVQASQPLAVVLVNQAILLADALHQPDAALSRAEEGARLAEEHALVELTHEIRPILERIRGQVRSGRT